MNMVSALVMAVKAFKKNVAKEVAEMSGGEYTTFVGDKRFEARVMTAARDARNRYLITLQPVGSRRPGCTRFACGPPRITGRGLWRGRTTGWTRRRSRDQRRLTHKTTCIVNDLTGMDKMP